MVELKEDMTVEEAMMLKKGAEVVEELKFEIVS